MSAVECVDMPPSTDEAKSNSHTSEWPFDDKSYAVDISHHQEGINIDKVMSHKLFGTRILRGI